MTFPRELTEAEMARSLYWLGLYGKANATQMGIWPPGTLALVNYSIFRGDEPVHCVLEPHPNGWPDLERAEFPPEAVVWYVIQCNLGFRPSLTVDVPADPAIALPVRVR